MPGLYDAWSLENSRDIPRYQGSTIPELTQVANTMQNRYDTGVQQADVLDRAISTSDAAAVDQPLLEQLKGQYRDKLKAYSDKGNYEDMWRNVAQDANAFHDQYSKISANQQAIASYQGDLNKRVSEGKLDQATAHARMAQAMDTYSGLRLDPQSGQIVNAFSGASTVPSVDIPEKVNKWLTDSHAIEKGWKVEQPDANGDWYITNGTETKKLPWSTIKPTIDAGIALDPEVKSWLQQEHELAPYYAGLNRKSSSVLGAITASQPTALGMQVNTMINQGLSPGDAINHVVGGAHTKNLIDNIYNYARKGVINDEKTEYGKKMTPLLEERMKKEQDKLMFSVPFSGVVPGANVNSEMDFENNMNTERDKAKQLEEQFEDARHAPGVEWQDDGIETSIGRYIRRESDGSSTDITSDVQRMKDQVDAQQKRVGDLARIKKDAADATGYHPDQRTAGDLAAIKKKEDDLYSEFYDDKLRERQQQDYRVVALEPGEADQAREAAHTAATNSFSKEHPAYKDYEKELVKRVHPEGTTNRMYVFKDDKDKQELADVANAGISKLGLKSGLVSLKVASGPNQGQQLSASDYDDIQGKVDPVGVFVDNDGTTKVMLRAMQDIKGKKVKGENMVMSMQDVGGIDKYMDTKADAQTAQTYHYEQELKSGMNNYSNSMNYPIRDSQGVSRGAVQITRKSSGSQGPGSFAIRMSTPNGFKQFSVDSYEKLAQILQSLKDKYK